MTAPRNTRATGAQQARNTYGTLKSLSGVGSLETWFQISHSELSAAMCAFGYRAHRTTIAHWTLGDRIPPRAARETLSRMLDWRVGIETGNTLTARLDSRWRAQVRRICDGCGRAFKARDWRGRYCVRCRR